MDKLGFTCLIALDEAVEILPGPLRRALAYVAPRASLVIADADPHGTEQALIATVDGHRLAVAVFDSALPATEYAHAVEKSLFWRDAGPAMEGHRAFVAISAAEAQEAHGLARAQAVAITRLAAALCEILPARGALWTSATTLSAPESVARAAAGIAQGKWPVDLWIGWFSHGRFGTPDQKIGIQTVGAADFLGFELLMDAFETDDPKEPLRILYGTAGYLMAHGSVIRDGQLVEVKGERRTEYTLHLGADGQPGLARVSVLERDHRKMH